MPHTVLTRVTAKTACEIAQSCELDEPARKLLRAESAPGEYLDLLVQEQQLFDAAKFLAQGLPKREAVWWACACVRSAAIGELAPLPTAALQAAEAWATEPNEERRRVAQTAAEKAGLDQPAACAALAAFLSEGSLGPENVAPIPPPEHAPGRIAAGAILLAAVQKQPEQAADKLRQFLSRGVEMANGKNLWN